MADRSRFSGMVGGCAVADAVGFPLEGSPRRLCLDYIEEVVRPRRFELAPCADGLSFGQYSDDTQLTRELLLSYVDGGDFKPARYAKAIAAIFRDGLDVGWGRATKNSARRLIEGVDWQESGEPPPSAGCGSAVRAGGLGLIYGDDVERLCRYAVEQSIITHRDSRAKAGALVVALMVARVCTATEPLKAELIDEAIGRVEPVDEGFAHALWRFRLWSALEPEAALSAMVEQCGIAYRDGISPYVVAVVLWALYSFFRASDDYMEILMTAISCGGDVDSTAAIACTIGGAYLGDTQLPDALTYRLTDRGRWGWQELKGLAHKVWTLSHRKEGDGRA